MCQKCPRGRRGIQNKDLLTVILRNWINKLSEVALLFFLFTVLDINTVIKWKMHAKNECA